MANIKVQYLGNEDGYALVRYGNNKYYCNANALPDDLVVFQWYTVDHRELMARGK